MTTATLQIPDAAARMLATPTVDLADAFAFLGIERGLGYKMATRYRLRVGGLLARRRPFPPAALRPERHGATWTEIPNVGMGGKYVVRTDLLVPMVFGEVAWP